MHSKALRDNGFSILHTYLQKIVEKVAKYIFIT